MGLLVMILGLVLFFAAHVFTTKRDVRAQAIREAADAAMSYASHPNARRADHLVSEPRRRTEGAPWLIHRAAAACAPIPASASETSRHPESGQPRVSTRRAGVPTAVEESRPPPLLAVRATAAASP